MHKLNKLDVEFNAAGVSDGRLNCESNLKRGCGGVAIIWKKYLDFSLIPSSSDRLCAI